MQGLQCVDAFHGCENLQWKVKNDFITQSIPKAGDTGDRSATCSLVNPSVWWGNWPEEKQEWLRQTEKLVTESVRMFSSKVVREWDEQAAVLETCAETQLDLQIENKLLSQSVDIVSVCFQKGKLEAARILLRHALITL